MKKPTTISKESVSEYREFVQLRLRKRGVRDALAEAFHLPEDQVRVIMPDMGSGYGGKHTGECAIEAARLAKSTGRPVKLVWTPSSFA